MPLFLGHTTAELILNKRIVEPLTAAFDQQLKHCWASRKDLDGIDLSVLEGLPKPYDVLVSSPDELRSWSDIKCHLCSTSLPSHSFLEINPDVFVASPQLCFVQQAQGLSLAQTIALGDRLCGNFALDKDGISGVRERSPLISVEDLYAYISRCNRVHGHTKAARASSFVLPGAASPMEIATELIFCLPRRLGGFGLPEPQMNYEITLNSHAKAITGKDFVRIDLYWQDFGFGLEYQGKGTHTSSSQLTNDLARQLAVEQRGIELQMLTVGMLRNEECRVAVARKIANRLGRRLKTNSRLLEANQRLVNELVPNPVA